MEKLKKGVSRKKWVPGEEIRIPGISCLGFDSFR